MATAPSAQVEASIARLRLKIPIKQIYTDSTVPHESCIQTHTLQYVNLEPIYFYYRIGLIIGFLVLPTYVYDRQDAQLYIHTSYVGNVETSVHHTSSHMCRTQISDASQHSSARPGGPSCKQAFLHSRRGRGLGCRPRAVTAVYEKRKRPLWSFAIIYSSIDRPPTSKSNHRT